MGADMVIYAVRSPAVDQAEAERRLAGFVDSLTDDIVDEVSEWAFRADGVFEADNAPMAVRRAWLKSRLSMAIGVLYDEHRRDVAWFTDSASERWLVTGGMSWGDEPTDAAEEFGLLSVTGFDLELTKV